LREGTNFRIPGFFPRSHTNIPVNMYLVKENGAWKMDLIAPRQAERQRIKEQAEVAEQNTERVWAQHERTRMEIQQSCAGNLKLLARWAFTNAPTASLIADETGQFEAKLFGARIVSSPADAGLRFETESDSAILPETLLVDQPCGVIAFWFRKESSGRTDRILVRNGPTARDLTVTSGPNGWINFNMPGQFIECRFSLEAGKFYHLALVWNDEGEKVYINGNVEIHGRQVEILRSTGTIELGGPPPFPQKNSGPRMTIRNLQFWEGKANDADIKKIFENSH
jgi:hypothetical protein